MEVDSSHLYLGKSKFLSYGYSFPVLPVATTFVSASVLQLIQEIIFIIYISVLNGSVNLSFVIMLGKQNPADTFFVCDLELKLSVFSLTASFRNL